MSFEARAVRESEKEECLRLWRTVWKGDNEAYFRRYFEGDVEWLPYYTQVGSRNGKLVSAAHICRRVVACGDFRLTMGGIANVATLPEYRGQGFNTECMQRAIGVMEADAMDFSLLFTGSHDYYARLGYARWPRSQARGRIRADFAPRPARCKARPATAEDLPAVRALYDAYNRTRPIAVQRYEAYWRDWMRIAPGTVPPLLFVAADTRGKVCGYAQCRLSEAKETEERGARVQEFAVRVKSAQEAREITEALLDALAATFQAQGAPNLLLDIPLEPAVMDALDAILETRELRAVPGGMARLLHRDNLLRSFAIEWSERWIAAGRPSGVLTFATPYGPTCLDATGAFLRVAPVENETGALSQETLFGLLFGTLPPEQATENTSLHPLLRTLFPPCAPIYWSADGF